MAKGRSGANRGWRSKMQRALDSNPELQARVNNLVKKRLEKKHATLTATSEAISGELSRLQSEISAISTPES